MSPYTHSLRLAAHSQSLLRDTLKQSLTHLHIYEINNIQALILYNVGEERITMGELIQRRYYLGSNVTYNVKKLVETGYMIQTPSPYDKRSYTISLTPKGLDLYKKLEKIFQRHFKNIKKETLKELMVTLKQAEKELLTQHLQSL